MASAQYLQASDMFEKLQRKLNPMLLSIVYAGFDECQSCLKHLQQVTLSIGRDNCGPSMIDGSIWQHLRYR